MEIREKCVRRVPQDGISVICGRWPVRLRFSQPFCQRNLALQVAQSLLLYKSTGLVQVLDNGKQSSQSVRFTLMLRSLMIPFLHQVATLQYLRRVHFEFCLSSLTVELTVNAVEMVEKYLL